MSSPCVFIFGAPTYLRFDLTPIAGTTFSYTPSQGTFADQPFNFRFCGAIPGVECLGALPSSSMTLFSDGSCLNSYGVSTSASALSLADGAGLVLTYAGGDAGAFSTFTLRCDAAVPAKQVAVDSLDHTLDSTGVAYVLRTAAACGVDAPREVAPLGVGWIAFMALLGALAAYFGGGALYNRRVSGARGLEAVPHIGAFRAAWARLRGGAAADEEAAYKAVGGMEEPEEPAGPPGANVQ
jgi:hypothetical protein